MTATPSRPADRYGDHATRRWWVAAAAVAAVLAVIAAVAFIAQASDAQIRASALSWGAPEEETLSVQVEVVRRPDTAVTCDVIAMDIRQIIVGQTELVVPATAERRIVVSVDVPLQGDAVAAEVRGCATADPQ